MLVYTYKLYKYVTRKIFPKILLNPNRYVIKGSFRRRAPYITDIDVVNRVYPKINRSNIHEHLVQLIQKIKSEDNIIIAFIKCGTDDRLQFENTSKEEIDRVKSLLKPEEIKELDLILKKYSHSPDKQLFFLNELLRPLHKLTWAPNDVIQNRLVLRGNFEISFQEIIDQNSHLLIKYYVRLGHYPVAIDAVINYEPMDMLAVYVKASIHHIKRANYNKEYYYLLFQLRRYFFHQNESIFKELDNLIEKKFGLYKQLAERIDSYLVLYRTHNLDIKTAFEIVINILKDISNLPDFNSRLPQEIKKVSTNNPPEVKMSEWNILLKLLQDEILTTVHAHSQKYFFEYLEKVPESERGDFYFINHEQKN